MGDGRVEIGAAESSVDRCPLASPSGSCLIQYTRPSTLPPACLPLALPLDGWTALAHNIVPHENI